MIGGEKAIVRHLDPVFATLARTWARQHTRAVLKDTAKKADNSPMPNFNFSQKVMEDIVSSLQTLKGSLPMSELNVLPGHSELLGRVILPGLGTLTWLDGCCSKMRTFVPYVAREEPLNG